MTMNQYEPSDERNFSVFDSPAEFAEACEKQATGGRDVFAYTDDNDKWCGGTFADALAFARHGDVSAVAEAERLVEKIDAEIDSDGVRPTWQPSVVGSFPLVPAYLAGTPEAMIARTDVPDPRGDIEVWVEMGAPARVSASQMRRRGVCVLAAVMALSRVRNVRVVCFTGYDNANMAIRLQYPLDISEACGMICQPSVKRRLTHGYSDALSSYFSLSQAHWGAKSGSLESYRKALREYAGMPEDAEIITRAKLDEWSSEDDAALVNTINSMLRRVSGKMDLAKQ